MRAKLMPPQLTGTPEQQIASLRDWMFQRVKELDTIANGEDDNVVVSRDGSGRTIIKKGDDSAVRNMASDLKSLILKTANEVEAYADRQMETFSSEYVARSEYGVFQQTVQATMETTAQGVAENYDLIQAVTTDVNTLADYYEEISGQVVRGIVRDPEYTPGSELHPTEYVIGLAISQDIQVSSEVQPGDVNNPDDGHTYYYLNSGQTFGLYTSTGWQFWINGLKVGWYSSLDGNLHVASIKIEKTLQMGDWILKQRGTNFGILYVGD